jgi:hypothetical protein
MSEQTIERHTYHAEATALSGHLTLPLEQHIYPRAHVNLRPEGGYLSQRSAPFRVEEVIRYESAYTHVAGNVDSKPGHPWNTLVTSVVEGLNILEVVTADRVVAQISTNHPRNGYIPTVDFLGTRFEGLRIAGHPVKLDLDLHLLGDKPANDVPYIGDSEFMERVKGQHSRILGARGVPDEVAGRFEENRLLTEDQDGNQRESVECSLVNQAEGGYPGRSFCHVIDIPNFGKIFLGVLRLEQSDYKKETGIPRSTTLNLTMIDCLFGCSVSGQTGTPNAVINGTSHP